MGRWEPGARDRLQAAAMDLYAEQGYERTTVAEIARRAELTERTFFRHFADKREVLFDGQHVLDAAMVGAAVAAAAAAPPRAVVAAALRATDGFFTEERRPWSRRRQGVIDANPSLQERELLKLAGMASSLAAALRDRGVAEPQATLAAESGLAVFRVAFAGWVAAGEERAYADLLDDAWAQLDAVTADR